MDVQLCKPFLAASLVPRAGLSVPTRRDPATTQANALRPVYCQVKLSAPTPGRRGHKILCPYPWSLVNRRHSIFFYFCDLILA
jgi:hypothetical protein